MSFVVVLMFDVKFYESRRAKVALRLVRVVNDSSRDSFLYDYDVWCDQRYPATPRWGNFLQRNSFPHT